jgi:hypothetical protein
MNEIASCHGVDVAFAWKRFTKGLFLIDTDGAILNREAPLLSDRYIVSVTTERAGAGGWIVSRESTGATSQSLSFVGGCTKETLVTVVNGLAPNAWRWKIWPSDTRGPTAWVEQDLPDGKTDWLVLDGAVAHPIDIGRDEPQSDRVRSQVGGGQLWHAFSRLDTKGEQTWRAGLEVCDSTGNCAKNYLDNDGCLVPQTNALALKEDVNISPVNAEMAWTITKQHPDDQENSSLYVICLLEPGKGLHRVTTTPLHSFECSGIHKNLQYAQYAIDTHHLWFFLESDSGDGACLYLIDTNETAPSKPISVRSVLGGDGAGGLWISSADQSFLLIAKQETIERAPITVPGHIVSKPFGFDDTAEEWQTRFSFSGTWVTTLDGVRFRDASGDWSPAILPNHRIRKLVPFSSRDGAWVDSSGTGPTSTVGSGLFAVHVVSQAVAVPAELHIGGAVLDTTKSLVPQITCAEPLATSLDLKWPGAADTVDDEVDGRIELSITHEREKPATASRALRDDNELVFKNAHCKPGRHTIILQYEDRLGSQLDIQWSEIDVISSFWNRRYVRTGLAFLALVGVAGIFALVRPQRFRAGGWLPSLGAVLAGGSEYTFLAKANIDFGWVAALTTGAAFLLLIAGAFSPRMFRQLAGIAPYDRVLPVAMTFGLFRRKLLAEYVERLRAVLMEQRVGASDESFFELPARIEDYPMSTSVGTDPRLPVDEIVNALADPSAEQRAHIYIEGPAGRGKSALVRAVVDKLLANFIARASAPLPVLCSKPSTEIEKLVEDEMLRDALSPSAIRVQLQRGLFVLVVDAVDESTWQPDQLMRLVRGSYQDSRVIVASRPSATRRAVFAHADRWKRVEPMALDEKTIKDFERHYLKADQASKLESHLLNDDLRRICQNGKDSYSPLLVRFAMRSPGERIASVYSLYGSVLGRLLRSATPDAAEPLLTKAAELCEDTLWRNGQREFTRDELDAKHHDVVIELKKSSVVVPVAGAAFRLRFFHSTVQSFLVARALAPRANGAIFATAAGDPRFFQEWSDLLGAAGSDVFHFLIHARSPEVVWPNLIAKLSDWCLAIGNDLGRSLILRACPGVVDDDDFKNWLVEADRSNATILAKIIKRLEPGNATAVETSQRAAETLAEGDHELHKLPQDQTFAALVELFAAIAPAAFRLEAKASARGGGGAANGPAAAAGTEPPRDRAV